MGRSWWSGRGVYRRDGRRMGGCQRLSTLVLPSRDENVRLTEKFTVFLVVVTIDMGVFFVQIGLNRGTRLSIWDLTHLGRVEQGSGRALM